MASVNYAMNTMRIVAALVVVVSHVRPMFFVDYPDAESREPLTQVMYAVTGVGHQAVLVFFVLSGYWVGGSVIRGLRQGRFSVGAFATARLTRLWLVLIPAILVTQVIDRVGVALRPTSDVYEGSPAYHTIVPAGGPIQNLTLLDSLGNIAFVQDLYVPSVGTNTPLWSLAAEFWYYLLFPALILVFARRVSIATRAGAAAVSIAAIALVSFPTESSPTQVLLLFPAWLLGALVAFYQGRIASRMNGLQPWSRNAIRTVALLAVLVTAIADSRLHHIVSTYALAIAAAGLTAAYVVDVRSSRARAALRPMSWASEWSYSLYATHMPVVALLAALIVPMAADRWQLTVAGFLIMLALTAVPVAFAIGFYMLTEKHTDTVRRAIRPAARQRPLRDSDDQEALVEGSDRRVEGGPDGVSSVRVR